MTDELTTTVPRTTLIDGTTIPQLGFGVFKVDDDGAERAVTTALETGYRLIDTAKLYGNEAGVGRAVRASGLPRDEVYVTSKVWNDDQGYDATMRAFEGSAERLDLGVVDLFLIHWPVPSQDLYLDSWRALLHLKEQGAIRSVGVSNFLPAHLERIIAEQGVVPVLNQVELHPRLQQRELRAFHDANGIATEAWSPLGRDSGLLDDPVVQGIAAARGVTPAQVVLRWHLDQGTIVIPKSVTPARIAENFDVFGFSLGEDDHRALDGMERGSRIGPDPEVFGA
ncbi:aldo/keto reductase [Cellulomonas sp. ATA003]|uniref:aldo/keto reductase n=1 Tax=Cellulomonas sp. ATA003 TaxID=3073064 RepID=UPI0028739FB7|nr:aldo/keto reductase [Cellulomonas sp. ATA003]WNB87024.1 aldo/keto reductase [Cellulomonas sp. ATA003]